MFFQDDEIQLKNNMKNQDFINSVQTQINQEKKQTTEVQQSLDDLQAREEAQNISKINKKKTEHN